MSYIGATGLDENQEQFDILKDEIDANASYINNLVGIPDPLHTAVFGINVLNPGLFGLVERAEVKIKLLETAEEGLGTDLTGLTTQVEGIQTEVTGIQTEILGIQGEITGIDSSISAIQFVQIPALGVLIGTADGIAVDARNKANRALDIWDYSGDNVYHKKAGNVGIGTTFGSTLTNKLEVQGNINIPTGSTFRINNEPFNYTHLAGEQPVSSKWTNATDVDTNIYYNSGNVGIGITTAINNKLEVAGNLNISAGSKYKINNVNLAFSDLGGSLSYNSLTNQLTGGTNIQILNGVINNTYTYTLPTATTNAIGGVRPDGTTILINNGVISSTAGLPATIRLTPTATDGFYSWINSQALLAKTPSTGVLYSSGSADGDIVLRSDTDKALILQSGIGDPAITLTAGLNRVRIHQRVGINTLPNTNYWLDVNGSINATEIRVGGNLIPISQWITSGANIYYSSGNVGIGTNANTSGVLLDVNGTIESRTGIGANSVFYFRGVANSDINRVISAGQFSTNSAVNDMVIRSTNKLVLQSGIGAPAIVISTTNNVGIGTTNPVQSLLHLHKTATAQDVRIALTDGTSTGATNRGVHFVKGSDNVAYLYNYENTALVFGTNGAERMRIDAGGQLGIGRTPNHILDVNGNALIEQNIFFGIGYYGGGRDFACNKIDLFGTSRQFGFGVAVNTLDYFSFTTHRFNTGSSGAGFGTERFRITDQGLRFQQDVWHANLSGNERFFFGNNSTTYIKGHGGNVPIQFRNGSDTPIAYFENDGQFVCSFQTRSVTDTDHLVVANNTNLFAVGQYKIHIAHNTFTGFHRCYYEDDEIFNNNMLKEEIDIFKNNYKGRIVISTGKIKTDFTREVKKETIVEEEPSATQNEEEEVKVDEEVKIEDITEKEATEEPIPTISPIPTEITKNEWYSAIDKDGITIEDAIPIVQLCRVKKDKRVYGVLGSPTRSTNNINRLIVNSVGEGAICVCNTNGNIENGDYIQSSELLGFGEKQDDDILHNYSVAKSVMDCTFELDSPYYQCYELEGGNGSVRVAFIACTYHAG